MNEQQVSVGEELPSFVRKTGLEAWNRFASVNEEFVPLHMDDAAGRESGFDGAIGMGNLQWSYFHNLLRDWIGDPAKGRIASITCKFEGANLKDTTVTVRGTVVEVADEASGRRVTVDLTSQDDRGSRLASGQAIVLLNDARVA